MAAGQGAPLLRVFCAVSAGRVYRLQNGTTRRQLSSRELF
jgi:hypothetical protein